MVVYLYLWRHFYPGAYSHGAIYLCTNFLEVLYLGASHCALHRFYSCVSQRRLETKYSAFVTETVECHCVLVLPKWESKLPLTSGVHCAVLVKRSAGSFSPGCDFLLNPKTCKFAQSEKWNRQTVTRLEQRLWTVHLRGRTSPKSCRGKGRWCNIRVEGNRSEWLTRQVPRLNSRTKWVGDPD